MKVKLIFLNLFVLLIVCSISDTPGITIQQNVTRNEIVFPPQVRAVINLIKPPYNLDNMGQRDCTEGLIRAFDDIVQPTYEGLLETRWKLRENPEGVGLLQKTNKKLNC